jgi:2EXR family
LIEVGSHDCVVTASEDDQQRSFFLRILSQFSVTTSIHTEQEEIPQRWFSPVALFVCHESRQHTLRHYRLIEHPEFIYESFYCDPSIDILWFNYEFTGDDVNHPHSQEYMDKLYQSYGTRLNLFRTVLVDEMFWDPQSRNQEYLGRLLGLETILIMDTSRNDTFRQDVPPIVYDKEDFEHFAAVGQKEYSNFKARHPYWPLKNIEYLTRDSKGDTSNNGLRTGTYPLVRRAIIS